MQDICVQQRYCALATAVEQLTQRLKPCLHVNQNKIAVCSHDPNSCALLEAFNRDYALKKSFLICVLHCQNLCSNLIARKFSCTDKTDRLSTD